MLSPQEKIAFFSLIDFYFKKRSCTQLLFLYFEFCQYNYCGICFLLLLKYLHYIIDLASWPAKSKIFMTCPLTEKVVLPSVAQAGLADSFLVFKPLSKLLTPARENTCCFRPLKFLLEFTIVF